MAFELNLDEISGIRVSSEPGNGCLVQIFMRDENHPAERFMESSASAVLNVQQIAELIMMLAKAQSALILGVEER